MYEIWEYEVEQYNTINKSDGLFTEMMNKFMKMKQQVSGWPINSHTDVEEKEYLKQFLFHEGIQLNENEVIKNSGLRSLAKLILNSFWGKFGQKENQSNC